jgi:hypothetical protein
VDKGLGHEIQPCVVPIIFTTQDYKNKNRMSRVFLKDFLKKIRYKNMS